MGAADRLAVGRVRPGGLVLRQGARRGPGGGLIIDATWVWRWMAEGLAVTALVAVALRLRPTLSASTRSLVWWCTLLAVLVLGSGLDWPGWGSGLKWPGWGSGLATYAPTVALPAPSQAVVTALLPSATTLLLAAWVVAATLRVTVLSVGLVILRRWRTRCRPLRPTSLPHLPAWMQLDGVGRRAAVMVSPDVRSPCVLGLWTPIIALPPSALALSAPALDAILVHEYAHVQRRDDLTQFLQHLIGAVCALHPAVWWIDRQLTIEREAACDDWVVTLATPTRAYVACLLALAAGERVDTALMPVRMTGQHSQLADRVRRLADLRRTRRLRTSWSARTVAPAVVTAMMCVVATAAGPAHAPVALPLPREAIAASVHPPPVPAVALARFEVSPVFAGASTRATPRLTVDRGAELPSADPPRVATPDVSADVDARPSLAHPVPAAMRVSTVPTAAEASHLPRQSVSLGIAGGPTSGAPSSSNEGAIAAPFRNAGVAVADAGMAAGRGVTRGGRATGGFFTRLGKRVATTF